MLRLAMYVGIVAALGSGVGCAAGSAPMAAAPDPAATGDMEAYALGPGDRLKITVFNVAEMTGDYPISPAGKISLPLVGDIKAGGGTTGAVADAIRAKLSAGFIKSPNVTVEVISYRPFYILGEVNRPGEFPYVANITVEQAIAAAGGYTYRAARRKAFLRRAGGKSHVVRFGDDPVYVMPGDTIRIGERYL